MRAYNLIVFNTKIKKMNIYFTAFYGAVLKCKKKETEFSTDF